MDSETRDANLHANAKGAWPTGLKIQNCTWSPKRALMRILGLIVAPSAVLGPR